MTDQQFEKCVKNNIPIYEIWISGSKIHTRKCSYAHFEKSWIGTSWINTCVWYRGDTRGMYVSGNNLNKCKLKLINALKREELQKIKKAEKQIERLCKMEEETK